MPSIVGNADNGKMMNEQEFEEFKNEVREARKNRLSTLAIVKARIA